MANVGRDLPRACERAGVPRCTPNDLRRTFASWLVQAGESLLVVSRLLGHGSTTWWISSTASLTRRPSSARSSGCPAGRRTPVGRAMCQCVALEALAPPRRGSAIPSRNQRSRQVLSCPKTELNRRHGDFQSPALPTELFGRGRGRNLHTDQRCCNRLCASYSTTRRQPTSLMSRIEASPWRSRSTMTSGRQVPPRGRVTWPRTVVPSALVGLRPTKVYWPRSSNR